MNSGSTSTLDSRALRTPQSAAADPPALQQARFIEVGMGSIFLHRHCPHTLWRWLPLNPGAAWEPGSA